MTSLYITLNLPFIRSQRDRNDIQLSQVKPFLPIKMVGVNSSACTGWLSVMAADFAPGGGRRGCRCERTRTNSYKAACCRAMKS